MVFSSLQGQYFYICLFICRDAVKCLGPRQEVTSLIKMSPVLVVRVYEQCVYDRLTFESLVNSTNIEINRNMYVLAGVTMFTDGHFCALVFLDGQCYWYDGLVGHLKLPPPDYALNYFPTHALYCRV